MAKICIEQRSMRNKQTFCLFYLFVRKTLYYRKCFILLLSISKKKAFYSGRLIPRRVKIGVSIKHTWKSELHLSAWIKFFIIIAPHFIFFFMNIIAPHFFFIAPHFDHLSNPSEILFQVHTLLVLQIYLKIIIIII